MSIKAEENLLFDALKACIPEAACDGVVDENGEIIIKGSVPTLKYRGIEDIVKDIATLCIRVVNNAKLNIDKFRRKL